MEVDPPDLDVYPVVILQYQYHREYCLDSSESSFTPSYEASLAKGHSHLGLTQVPGWLANRLAALAPSKDSNVNRLEAVWSNHTTVPPDPRIKDMVMR